MPNLPYTYDEKEYRKTDEVFLVHKGNSVKLTVRAADSPEKALTVKNF
jgi:hypothetical protein